MGWFNGWFGTPWYKILYRHRDAEDAADLVLPLIVKAGLRPGQQVLDMACGRGRHAAVLVRAGMVVTGIDISQESIEEARAEVPGARFEVHDIRRPYASGHFDAVTCLFTSLGYSDDRADDHAAVSAAAVALKPGGRYVLDLMNGELVRQQLITNEEQLIDGVRFSIQRGLEGADIVKRIRVQHPGGIEDFEERVHAWRLDEVAAMVEQAGLALEDVTDGSCGHPFDPRVSDRFIIWARKPA